MYTFIICRNYVNAAVTSPRNNPPRKSHVKTIEWEVSNSWQLRGLSDCYGVYVPLFFAKISLRGSYGTDLRSDRGITSFILVETYGIIIYIL